MTHAGTWYDNNRTMLEAELKKYMDNATLTQPSNSKLKALIAPHAGYAYSGPTAGWAYRNLRQHAAQFDRVVLLGPSHKVFLDFIGTTTAEEWETPLGNIQIDIPTIDSLIAQAESLKAADLTIQKIQMRFEENEHSLELHLPYIKKCFKDAGKTDFKLVPLMIGKIPENQYHNYATLLLPLFKDERTVFVVSSDFCHWGERFHF